MRHLYVDDKIADVLDLGTELSALCADQAIWSQDTFGPDDKRGPIGPLRHLAREAKEAEDKPKDIVEYADCLLLLLDARRRAGFTIADLIRAAQAKMVVNRAREWPVPVDDEPVEHIA